MSLNYKPIGSTISEKGLKKIDVIVMGGLTTNVMTYIGKDKPIIYKVL